MRSSLFHVVPIAVGSDNPVGIGTHNKMEMLREAGFTPARVLDAALWGGAKTLGMEEKTGLFETGKQADIVILNSNPLRDIRNARVVAVTFKQEAVCYRDSLMKALFQHNE